MPKSSGYAVIRFKKQGGEIYKILDYKQGDMLFQKLRGRPQVEKPEVFHLMYLLTMEMQCLCQGSRHKSIFPMTPYNVLVTEENEVLLLDLTDGSNREILRNIQKNSECKPFRKINTAPNEDSYYFSYGKTLQYIVAHININPKLTVWEEKQILTIIHRCLNDSAVSNQFNFNTILKQFLKHSKHNKNNKKIRKCLCLLAIVGMAGFFSILFFPKRILKPHSKASEAVPVAQVNSKPQEESKKAYETLGMEYFLKQDYTNSRKYFAESTQSKKALCFLKLSEYMLGMEQEDSIQNLVQEAEEMRKEEPAEVYDLNLFRIQRTISGENAGSETIRLGEKVLSEGTGEAQTASREERIEVYEGLAEVYEQYEDTQKMIEIYEKIITEQPKQSLLEAVYQKLPLLYDKNKEEEKAVKIAEQAVEAFPFSVAVRVQYLEYQCKSKMPREACQELVRQAIDELPELKDSMSFQKLKRGYNIIIEGDTVCIEK